MDPMSTSMVAGMQTGNANAQGAQGQSQSSPPSAYQTQGVPGNYAILCRNLKSAVASLNESGSVLMQQGANKTALANQLYKAAYDASRVCEQLEKEAAGAGQQQ